MTDAQWTRLADLVPDALALPPDARAAFLDRTCTLPDGTPDAALRREAEALLQASLDADASGALRSPVPASPDAPPLPDRIGPWRVTGLLGEGGMGVVYRAERADGLFEREVALKRIRPGLGQAFTPRLVAERRVLARLEHDGIARLYDGGVDEAGAPYVVMELADGAPITDAAEAAKLDVAARVRLFRQVCDAVAYAHGHLVVHRDLKPSNVFVTAGGTVKLLDFGIAKLLGEDGADAFGATLTRTQAAMTPSYAAPEQLTRGEVTTATDVYALGVMLYELLAGTRPYSLDGTTPAEAERIVCETDPPPPSAIAPPESARALRGDLDVIVGKALAKDPSRRYASAEALGADLQRHLDGVPVLARSATAGYRARRFVQRHRVGVAAAAVVVTALVVGAGVALGQAQKARAEAAKAVAVNDFLVGLLGAADPTVEGRDVRVASLLDRAAADLDSVFAGQPDVEATMRMTLGETYYQLGLYDEAEAQYARALALREPLLGTRHPDVVRAQTELAFLWVQQDHLGPADSLLTIALASARTFRGEDELLATVLSSLGSVRYWQGDQEASLDFHRQAAEAMETADEPNEVEIAAAYGNVAVVLHELGRDDEAIVYMERELEVYRRTYEPTNARIAMALRNLASGYHGARRYDDAVRTNEQAIAIFRQAVDPDSPDLANTLSNHGPTLIKVGRYAEAEAAAREAMGIYERTVGTETQNYASALLKASQAQELQGETAAAEAGIRRAIAIFRASGPEDHPAMGYSQLALGKLLAAEGRDREAATVLRRAFAIRSQSLAADHPDRADIASRLGEVLGRLGQRAEAESLLVSGATVLRRAPNDEERAREATVRLAAFRQTR